MFSRRAATKPFLSPKNISERLAFAHMASSIIIARIVFTDKMWVEFNSSRRMKWVTRPKGSDPHEYAIHRQNDEGTIRIMFWGAICLGCKGPYHIWKSTNDADKQRYKEIAIEVNRARAECVLKRQAQAKIPGTPEWKELIEFNANIDAINQRENCTGNRKGKYRTADKMFKEDPIREYEGRGGITWQAYQEKMVNSILYPWIDELQKLTGIPITYLVEDNAPAHTTIKSLHSAERAQRGIITLK